MREVVGPGPRVLPGVAASGRRRARLIAWGRQPAIVFLLAAGWFLYRIGRPGVWTDEGVTLTVIHRTPGRLWRLWHGNDAPMMPYYLAMKTLRAIVDLLGLPVRDVVLVRSVSALAMAGAAVALYLLVRRRAGVSLALAVTVTFVALPGVLRYAQEARPYALMMLAGAASWLAWDLNRERPARRVRVAYVVAVVFGVLVHLFFVFQMVAQAAAALLSDWRHGARRPAEFTRTLRTLGPLAAGGVIAALPALYIVRHGHGVPSDHPVSLAMLERTLVRTVLNLHVGAHGGAVVLLLAVAGVVALRGQHRETRFVLVLWLAVPLVLGSAVAVAQPGTLRLRYWMPLATPFAALMGAGVHGLATLAADLVGPLVRRNSHHAPHTGPGAGSMARTAHVAGIGAALAITVLLLMPGDAFVRSDAGHGPVGATAPVMAVVDATPGNPVLLVDSRFNGFAFAGYGVRYVVDNPYATPDPGSTYAWGVERTPGEFLAALDGHDSVVLAHIEGQGGSTPATLDDSRIELAHAGFRLIRTRRAGDWTIMVYERSTAQAGDAPATLGG